MALLNISNPYTSELIATLHLQSREEAVEVFNMSFDLFIKVLGIIKSETNKGLRTILHPPSRKSGGTYPIKPFGGWKPLHDSIIEMDRALEGVKLVFNPFSKYMEKKFLWI